MFGISSTEYLLIAIVALVVIGPKELPAVMRTIGQWTRKVRGMASEFQNQFQEAMREAEMADLKKQVDDMARDVKDIDPLKGVRDDIENVGKDVESSLRATSDQPAALPPAGVEPASTDPAAEPPPTEPAVEPAPASTEAASAPALEAPASPSPETVEKPEHADGTGSPG